MSEKLNEIRERWAEMPCMDVGVDFDVNRDFLYDIESKEIIATMQRELDRDRSYALSRAKSDIDHLLSLLDTKPAADLAQQGVQVHISKETGGAYADPKEVIEDELKQIKTERAQRGGVSELISRAEAIEAAQLGCACPWRERGEHRAGCMIHTYCTLIGTRLRELPSAGQCVFPATGAETQRGADTNWPLSDVLTKAVAWLGHLHDHHNCDCHGWEERSFIIEAAERYAKEIAATGAEGGEQRWRSVVENTIAEASSLSNRGRFEEAFNVLAGTLRSTVATPPVPAAEAGETTREHRWRCACGWVGTPSQMTVSNDLRSCPQCGGSGGLILDASVSRAKQQRNRDHGVPWTMECLSCGPSDYVAAPSVTEGKEKLRTDNPFEQMVERSLRVARLAYSTDHDGTNESRLDFYIPTLDVHVEVKTMHSDRIAEQMSRVKNVVVAQGVPAIKWLASLIARAAPSPADTATDTDEYAFCICGSPRYAHHIDLRTGKYTHCLICNECLNYEVADGLSKGR